MSKPTRFVATLEAEIDNRGRGRWPVAGIDEAGRGPLAGPVVAAAVILDPDDIPDGLADSKALNRHRREAAYDAVLSRALAVSVSFASVAEIDGTDIRRATHAAMTRAWRGLAPSPLWSIVDGNDLPVDMRGKAETMVKGDAKCLSVAAASIVAKVTRDRLMTRLHTAHPEYGFDAHAGYGTAAHLAAIAAHGPCAAHRMTFSPMRPKEVLPDLFSTFW